MNNIPNTSNDTSDDISNDTELSNESDSITIKM